LADLKRELAQVKKERDFLKEAATFFAKQSKRSMNALNVANLTTKCG